MSNPIDWTQLRGKTFQTITGTSFTVTNVTRKNVLIRPKHGRRDYDLSISNELERGLDALFAGVFFPSPTELVRVGIRHERNSYVWGVLKIVWKEQLTQLVPTVRSQDFAGYWQITELAEMDESYIDESDEEAQITFKKPSHGNWDGSYHFGLSDGEINGAVREFGGEALFIFGFEGSDEMDTVAGGGWARINGRDELEGEFLSHYGEFKAVRKTKVHARGKKSQ